MKYINYLLLTLVAAVGCVFTSCEDDNDTNLSRAVLASVSLLEFEKESADVAIIKVTSDADWYVEAPEWVIVSPSSGHAGRTEVTVQVMDNYRDGALDNPRKANVLFKGRDLNSIATVRISQDGDRYRDPIQYLTTDLENLEDEVYVQVADLVVTAVTGTGFIATDGNYNLYVTNPETAVSVGQKLTAHGEKMTDTMGLIYIADAIIKNVTTGSFTLPTPVDITDNLDNIKYKTREYVTVTGNYDGSSLSSESALNNKVYFEDSADALNIGSLGGHKLKVTGYYAGTAAPMVKIIPTIIEDLGSNEVIFFFEDFEWLAPWAAASAAGTQVEDSGSGEAPQIIKTSTIYEGKTAAEALQGKGYDFVFRYQWDKDPSSPDVAIYLQNGYLKFCKTGNLDGLGYQAGLVLPSFEVPEDTQVEASFDWCSMRQGSGVWDATNLCIIIDNGGNEEFYNAPVDLRADNDPYYWSHATISLGKVTINKNTKITIRTTEEDWAMKTAHRWFIDNIKFRQK